MTTLTLTHPVDTERLLDVEKNLKISVKAADRNANLEDAIEIPSDTMSFRALVLQRNWVKDVITYINEQDLSNLLGADRYQMVHIKQKIKEKGVCRFRKRIGFFKYLVYEIQNWWDYDGGF